MGKDTASNSGGDRYILIYEGVTVSALLEGIKAYRAVSSNEVPLGLADLENYLHDQVEEGKGHLPVTLFNSGETTDPNRPLRHVLGKANPLPRVLAEIMNNITTGSVTNAKSAFLAFSHAPEKGSTKKRMVMEAILGAILNCQPQFAAKVFPPSGDMSDVVVAGLQYLSPGHQHGRLLFHVAALQADVEHGQKTLAALRGSTDHGLVRVADFMVDRLTKGGAVTQEVAAELTLKEAWSIFCSWNGHTGGESTSF